MEGIPLHIMSRTLTDAALKKLVQRIQEKIAIFDQLRDAMRIACPDKTKGLNDGGDDDIKTIESRVSQFRHSPIIVRLAANDTHYYKMVKQIDKYWDKLFADIDLQQVREEEKENESRWRKYPKRMCKIFAIPHLPEKMMKIA